jgi:hypothetical protein
MTWGNWGVACRFQSNERDGLFGRATLWSCLITVLITVVSGGRVYRGGEGAGASGAPVVGEAREIVLVASAGERAKVIASHARRWLPPAARPLPSGGGQVSGARRGDLATYDRPAFESDHGHVRPALESDHQHAEEGHERMSPAKTAPIPEDAEAGFETLIQTGTDSCRRKTTANDYRPMGRS